MALMANTRKQVNTVDFIKFLLGFRVPMNGNKIGIRDVPSYFITYAAVIWFAFLDEKILGPLHAWRAAGVLLVLIVWWLLLCVTWWIAIKRDPTAVLPIPPVYYVLTAENARPDYKKFGFLTYDMQKPLRLKDKNSSMCIAAKPSRVLLYAAMFLHYLLLIFVSGRFSAFPVRFACNIVFGVLIYLCAQAIGYYRKRKWYKQPNV